MSSRFIRFEGSKLTRIEQQGQDLLLHFEPAMVLRSIPGAQDSLWQQSAQIRLMDVGGDVAVPELPKQLEGGAYEGGHYSYDGMAPAPTAPVAPARLVLQLQADSPSVEWTAAQISTELLGMATYQGHVD